MASIREEAREIPVVAECDVCVVGGSCTGVFAAVRAARLGARVVVVEKQGRFGGVATNSLVNVWHSLYNTDFTRQIIAGLTQEVVERLRKRDAITQIDSDPHKAFVFNSEELAIELDELVLESKVRPFLHTVFAAPIVCSGSLVGVAVENKSGRRAIRAAVFVDATGDADLCHRLGLSTYVPKHPQPPTTCARIAGWRRLRGVDVKTLVREHGADYNLPYGFIWGADVPGSDVHMLAGTRVTGRNCAEADDLTLSELEGRRQIRAILDIVRHHAPGAVVTLQALPSLIGIRETRHVECLYRLRDEDVLYGKRFDDAIANGSYRVDVHHQDRPGITLKYLDGTEVYTAADEKGDVVRRWREETKENPTFYQIPLRSLVPPEGNNVIVAGRALDAEPQAFAGARVMVNMNQTGEAAGVASYLALSGNWSLRDVDPEAVRRLLGEGGSIVV